MEGHKHSPGREHFSEQRWSDFVRGLSEPQERHEMQAHLDSGCERCQNLISALRMVQKLGQLDASLIIPDEAVSRARALFEPPRTASWLDSLTPLIAQLVSPTSPNWQPAGVRSPAAAVSGRMLFRAGDYSVDLAVDAPLPDQPREIIGQIANEHDRGEQLEGVLVQMVASGRIVGETSTNRFGEFIMDYPKKKVATLHFALKHRGQRIDLPLKLGERP